MNLNDENTVELLEKKFSLDFIQITLTQKGCENPIVYSGPGMICQKEDGMFHLKLYHSFVDTQKEWFGKTGEIVPGKIMGDEHYFSLAAVDMKGQKWTAERVYVSGGFSFPAAGKVINSKIRELSKIESRDEGLDTNKSYLLMLVKGDFQIPANEIEDRNDSRHLNTVKIQNDLFTLEIRARDGHIRIKMCGESEFFKENTQDILIEALSIIFGKQIIPVFTGFTHGDSIVTKLISASSMFPNSNLFEPVPYKFPRNVSPFKDFIEKYLLFATEPYTDLFGFWHKINRAWQGGIVNAALTVTVAIEGIIKSYFKEYGYPDDEFIKQVNASIEPIQLLNIGTRVKDRIITSINGAKSSNPRSALIKLAAIGYFDKKLVDEWKSLRNMSAHADKLDSDKKQKYIDKVNNCLLLFYKLLFIAIKYENLYFDFSQESWPEILFVLPEVTKEIS